MTYYFCLNDFDIFALTFAFRSNVEDLNANVNAKMSKSFRQK
jgi:hypothetical protein